MCLLQNGRRPCDVTRFLQWALMVLVLLSSVTVTTGLEWVTRPTSQNVTVGGTVLFKCEVRGTDPYQLIWNKDNSVLFLNGVRSSDVTPRYNLTQGTNLLISDVKSSDDAKFSCNIFSWDSVEVQLTVFVPPEPPSITLNSSISRLEENSVISFTCSSKGGKPAPDFVWLRNGQVVPNAVYTPPAIDTKVSSSQIVVTLGRDDDQANFTCVVSNAAIKLSPHHVSRILNVQYSPSIQFSPAYSPYLVKPQTDVTIRCDVDAKPPPNSISWLKNGFSYTSSSASLTFASIRKTDAGNYTCVATNSVQGTSKTTSASTTINVIYPPIVTTQTTIVANISSQVNMTCHVDANPPAYQVRWQKLEDPQIYTNGPNFVFNAQRKYDGVYECTASSRLEPSGQDSSTVKSRGRTMVRIRYAPGHATISPTSSVLVGQPIILTCNVDDAGYPSPVYEWRRAGSPQILQSTTSNVYRISSAKLNDNARYSCLPKNIMGQGVAATIEVVVNSPPVFVKSTPSEPTLTIPISQSNMLIEHKIEGRPLPDIQWYKDGVPVSIMADLYRVETSQEIDPVDKYLYIVTTRISFIGSGRSENRLRVEDMGNYTCHVTSSARTSPTVHSTFVYITFPPQVMADTRVAADSGEVAILTCEAQAFPTPTFNWYKQGQRLSNSSRVFIGYQALSGTAQHEGTLTIQQVTQIDFAVYMCDIRNQVGTARKNVTLSVKAVPDPPHNVASVQKTWESVKLTWDRGFNGGYSQSFFVSHRSIHGEKNIEVYPRSVTSFNVSRLMPHTSYTFHVFGQNQLGKGANSEGLTVKTDVLVFPPLKEIPEFIVDDKQLKIPNDLNQSYCVRVETSNDNGKVWTVNEPCVPASDGVVALGLSSVTNVNVSVCLVYRPEVCGEPVVSSIRCDDGAGVECWRGHGEGGEVNGGEIKSTDEASTPDLTETQVIIIGCVCAGILIILLIILFYIICRRKLRNKNNYANDPHSSRTIPQGNGTLANQKSHSYDNQGYASSSNDVLVSSRNGFGQYHPQGGDHYPQGGEHYPMTNTSYDDSFSFDKQYEYDMNRRNANVNNDPYYNDKQGDISFNGSPRTPTKDPQQFMTVPEEKHEGGSFGSGQESGYSTPDGQTKPKKTWRFRPPTLNFLPQHRPGRKKHLRANPDMVPYSHDPPGHTCGLPCCSEDLQIQLRIRRQPKSCIGIQEHDVAQQNFTFRGRQKARPELLNGFFSVQQPKDQRRGEIPKFGTLNGTRMSRITEEQQTNNFLKGREITLPESDDPYATEKLYLDNFSNGESDDILEGVSDSEIEYYMTVKGPCDLHGGGVNCQSDPPTTQLYPWQMLQEMKYNAGQIGEADDSGSSSDYYEVLRYPDDAVIKSSDVAAEFSNVLSTQDNNTSKQFYRRRTVPLPPVPPRPPKRNKLNHPPLNKNSVSSSEKSDSLYATPPKYNTYSSVHSINCMQEKAARDLHERYLSLDRLYDRMKSHHRDARDIDFSGQDTGNNQNVKLGTLSKQKFKKILQKNEYITENLKADFRKMDTNLKNGEMTDSDKSTIAETISSGSTQLVNDAQQEVKMGISNPAFRHADVDGKVIGTRHLDIEGRLLGTRSLGGYGRTKPSPGNLEQKLKGGSLAGYGRTAVVDENPITLIL